MTNGLLNLGMMSVFLFGALADHVGFKVVFVLAGGLVAASATVLIPDRTLDPPPSQGQR
jgi:inner membrane protein involved in colicin E2 resistance